MRRWGRVLTARRTPTVPPVPSRLVPLRPSPMVGETTRARAVAEKLAAARAENERLRAQVFAVRRLIDPNNPCHDGFREALLDAESEARS